MLLSALWVHQGELKVPKQQKPNEQKPSWSQRPKRTTHRARRAGREHSAHSLPHSRTAPAVSCSPSDTASCCCCCCCSLPFPTLPLPQHRAAAPGPLSQSWTPTSSCKILAMGRISTREHMSRYFQWSMGCKGLERALCSTPHITGSSSQTQPVSEGGSALPWGWEEANRPRSSGFTEIYCTCPCPAAGEPRQPDSTSGCTGAQRLLCSHCSKALIHFQPTPGAFQRRDTRALITTPSQQQGGRKATQSPVSGVSGKGKTQSPLNIEGSARHLQSSGRRAAPGLGAAPCTPCSPKPLERPKCCVSRQSSAHSFLP